MIQTAIFAGVLGLGAAVALLFPRGRAEAALAQRRFFNSREGDESPVLEIVPTSSSRKAQSCPKGKTFVPLRSTRLTGEIADVGARLTLIQTFRFHRNQCPHTIQAFYRFPLPGDAAVVGVKVFWKDFELETELKERGVAEKTYRNALKEGKAAALLMRESPDIFTLAVAGIDPDEDVRVETTYVQCPRREGKGWSLRVPLTMGPRYVRQGERGRAPSGQPLALFRDPGHRFSCDLVMGARRNPLSPTHGVLVTPDPDSSPEAPKVRVTLEGGAVIPDRDFVLTWAPEPEDAALTLTVRTAEMKGEDGETKILFSALVTPPAQPSGPLLPREMVLLVDHSGSMEGAKWEATDWAVRRFLENLRQDDRFVVGLFHTSTRWLSSELLPATEKNVERGIRFVLEHKDSGGTEMRKALQEGLAYARCRGDFSRHLVILTDGAVSDEANLFLMAEQEFSRSNRRRISVLCIDSAPNEFLARNLAERGGGEAAFLTSDPDEGDITTALEELLASWNAPLARDCRLEINRPWGAVPGRRILGDRASSRATSFAVDLGDLLPGRPVVVSGVAAPGEGPLEGRLLSGRGEESAELARSEGRPTEGSEASLLRSVVGARILTDLENLANSRRSSQDLAQGLRALGYESQGLPFVSETDEEDEDDGEDEETSDPTAEVLTKLLVREALRFGVACSALAFVAVCREKGRVVKETALVPNATPQGWRAPRACYAPSRISRASSSMMSSPRSESGQPMVSCCKVLYEESPEPGLLDRIAAHLPTFSPSVPTRSSGESDAASRWELFRGMPEGEGETVLFDRQLQKDQGASGGFFKADVVIGSIGATLEGAEPPKESELLIFLEDQTLPRLRLALRDVLAASEGTSGGRPVNLRWISGTPFRLVLRTPLGSLPSGAVLTVWWRPR